MALKSPVNNHSFWGSFATSADLPNVAGAATQDAALEAGDRAWVVAGPNVYYCVDATLGAAVWQPIAAGGATVEVIPIEFGNTVAVGDAICSGQTAGRCMQGEATGGANSKFLGIALTAGTGNLAGTVECSVLVAGKMTDAGAAFTRGALFLPLVPGRPTNSPPGTVVDSTLRVGNAYSATEYIIQTGEGFEPRFLLDFEGAGVTFARASEASWEVSPGFVKWWAAGQPRILYDGSVVIEGSRTNVALRSEEMNDGFWLKPGAFPPTVAPDSVVAPDGAADADEVDWAASATSEMRGSVAGADSIEVRSSWFLRRAAGAGAADMRTGLRDKAGVSVLNTHTVPEAWTRYFDEDNNGVGGNVPIIQVFADVGGVGGPFGVWGAQYEQSVLWSSSYIRTAGAPATRFLDSMVIAAANVDPAIVTGRSLWTFWPEFSSNDVSPFGTSYRIFAGAGNNGLLIRGVAGVARIAYFRASGAPNYEATCTWSRGQQISVILDWVAGEMTIAGCTTGNGTFSFPLNDSELAGDDLQIGKLGAGTPFYGRIARPRAV